VSCIDQVTAVPEALHEQSQSDKSNKSNLLGIGLRFHEVVFCSFLDSPGILPFFKVLSVEALDCVNG